MIGGTIDTKSLNLTASQELDAVRATEEIKARMSPPGALGLPPLLEKRRLEHGLVDEMFRLRPLFDRVFVYQMEAAWAQGDCFPGTSIVRPERTKERNRKEAPVGILIGAGQKALDDLRANGIELGHMVAFIRLSPWAMPVAMVAGKEVPVMMLRAGDLLGGFDLADGLIAGKTKIVFEPNTQQHLFVDEEGLQWAPRDPTEDFEE